MNIFASLDRYPRECLFAEANISSYAFFSRETTHFTSFARAATGGAVASLAGAGSVAPLATGAGAGTVAGTVTAGFGAGACEAGSGVTITGSSVDTDD